LNLTEEGLPILLAGPALSCDQGLRTPTAFLRQEVVQMLGIEGEVVVVLAALVEGVVTGRTKDLGQGLHALRQADVIEAKAHVLASEGGTTAAVIMDPQTGLHGTDDGR
jgi:hypothetical protein